MIKPASAKVLAVLSLFVVVVVAVKFNLQKDTQQAFFNKQYNCTATFKGTIRKGETVTVFEVVNERGGGMVRYKIDNHKNPTWLYASNFDGLNCKVFKF